MRTIYYIYRRKIYEFQYDQVNNNIRHFSVTNTETGQRFVDDRKKVFIRKEDAQDYLDRTKKIKKGK